MSVKLSRVRKADRTRRTLCRHAARLFARKGYGGTSINEIVRGTGLTKGAFYHHFAGKLEIYQAVVEDMERDLVARVEAEAGSKSDAWHRLQAMCAAYLDACLDPALAHVLVIEAPVVLGWKVWCEISNRYELAAFSRCLEELEASGRVGRPSAESAAQVLLGALNTAARVIATSDQPEAGRAQVEATIQRLLSGLRAPN